MTFINQYIKKDESRYVYSEQFNELESAFVFAVGETESLGLITKLDTNGDIVWEKLYRVGKENTAITIMHLVQLFNPDEKNPYSYIAYLASAGDRHFIMNISGDTGEVIWVNELRLKVEDSRIYLAASKKEYAFYMAVSGGMETSASYTPVIGKFEGNGKMIMAHALLREKDPFMISSLSYEEERILVSATVTSASVGLLLELNTKLDVVNTLLFDDSAYELYDAKMYDEKSYLVTGKKIKEGKIFVSKIAGADTPTPYYSFPSSNSGIASLCLIDDDFYLHLYDAGNGITHRFNDDFICLWSKEIVVSRNHTNQIRSIRQFDRRLTFNGYDKQTGYFVGNTDENLRSSKTNTLNAVELLEEEYYPKSSRIIISSETIDMEIAVVETDDINSEVDPLLPPVKTFVNRYTRREESIYHDVAQVSELVTGGFSDLSKSFVLAVGENRDNALVTKLALDGAVQWNRTYYTEKSDLTLSIEQVIQITDNKSENRYIMYVSGEGNRHFIMSISSDNGELLWVNEFFPEVKNAKIWLKESGEEYAFFMAVSENRNVPSIKYPAFIGKFDKTGNVILSQRLFYQDKPFAVSSLDTYKDQVIISGNDTANQTGMVISLNSDLKLGSVQLVNAFPNEVYDVKWSPSGEYIVTGKDKKNDLLFVYRDQFTGKEVTVYTIPDSGSDVSSLSVGQDGFYLTQYGKNAGVTSRFDEKFRCLWTKEIEIPGSYGNGIESVKQREGRLTFKGYDESGGSFIGNTGAEFNTDKTKSLPPLKLVPKKNSFQEDIIQIKEDKIEITGTSFKSEEIKSSDIEYLNSPFSTFINQYLKKDPSAYFYARQFEEEGRIFTMAAGTVNGQALLSKIDFDGTVIWEQSYLLEKEALRLTAQKIVQIADVEYTDYIVYITSGDNRHFLLSISSEGTINWMEEIPVKMEAPVLYLEASPVEYAFYLVISGGKESSTSYYPYIYKFDHKGQVVAGRELIAEELPFEVKAMDCYNGRVALACTEQKSLSSFILDFDDKLNLVKRELILNLSCELYDVKYYRGLYYLVAGKNMKSDQLFVMQIGPSTAFSTRYEILKSESMEASLAVSGHDFYLVNYSKENGTIYRFDGNFTNLWGKEIVVSENHTNGIRYLDVSENGLTFTGYDPKIGYFVGNINEDLESSNTQLLGPLNLVSERSFISRRTLAMKRPELNPVFVPVSLTRVVSQLNSILGYRVGFVIRNRFMAPLEYTYTEQFTEGIDTPIFAVGKHNTRGLIMKIGRDGEPVWEYLYSINSETSSLMVHKIVQVVGSSRYVVYMSTANNRHFLMSIYSLNGSVIWIKEFFPDTSQNKFYLERVAGARAFYLIASGSEYGTTISKYNDAGNLLLHKRITMDLGDPILINSASTYRNGLLLVALASDNLNRIIHLNPDFEEVHSFFVVNLNCEIYDVQYYQDRFYLVLGRNLNTNRLFICPFLEQEGDYSYYEVYNTAFATGKLCLLEGLDSGGNRYQGDFYIHSYKDDNGTVHRFNSDYQVVWSKEIVLTHAHKNRIKFIKQVKKRLTFNGYENNVGYFLGNTDENLNCCRTLALRKPTVRTGGCYQKLSHVKLEDIALRITTPGITISDILRNVNYLCPAGSGVGVSRNPSFQSPNLVLQAAGSTGTTDGSAKGIHLRWAFSGALAGKHLPKGNYAQTRHHFNKRDDFVKIYRAPYERVVFNLDFQTAPTSVDHSITQWVYVMGGKTFYIRFLNRSHYNFVLNTINPLRNPLDFMRAYGDQPIEVESLKHLFFAVGLNIIDRSPVSSVKTETLSVRENRLSIPKYTNSRQTYSASSSSTIRLAGENAKSVRYSAYACHVSGLAFEFYADFLSVVNDGNEWENLGEYALSLDSQEVYAQLEPVDGLVHGKWLRFNDEAYVNIENYKDKWNGELEGIRDRNIKTVVAKFIELSDAADNPRANETIFLGSDDTEPQTPDDLMDLSLLDLLNVGANDYHVARMLGLGILDIDSRVFSGKYVYIAQYFTYGDLEDGQGAREVEHLFMSIPTSISDERLPVPVTLERIASGIVNDADNQNSASHVTDSEGYTSDGRYRYVTLLAEPEIPDEINQPFYATSREFDNTESTLPIYGGVEYRRNNEASWVKPELSSDPDYKNVVPDGQIPHNETIPLIVSEDTGVLYIHKQRYGGRHFYSSYGINIFSRATSSPVTLFIDTDLKPGNTLKPPVNIRAHLVRQERPLLLTSQQDQNRYEQLSGATDKTLIRLTFDYHTHHELTTYMVEELYEHLTTPQLENNSSEAYPNDLEIYAEEIELFFRNQLPRSVSGKATAVDDDPANPLLSVITTQSYHLTSTGEDLIPNIPADLVPNYVGGVFLIGDQRYIIHSIVPHATNPTIKVYKREISDTLVLNDIPSPDADNLQAPELVDEGLFTVLENMQNTGVWGSYNPHSLRVKVGADWTVKREVFQEFNESEGVVKRYLEKSRGIWKDAVVEAQQEPVDVDENENVIYGYNGLYKITFTGFTLPQHTQYNAGGVSVEWYNGIVRLKRKPAFQNNGERTRFDVVRMENNPEGLIVYIQDPDFDGIDSVNAIRLGTQSTNYYPGYKVYLYADPDARLTEGNILPAGDEEVRYSIFGLRSHDLDYDTYYSRMSEPVLMFAQKLEEPQRPELPEGPLYATRPDFFGKSTYSFNTRFTHRPTNVLFYRANDEAFLNALYKKETLNTIRLSLEPLGGNDEEYLVNRWVNFLDFEQLEAEGSYKAYPPSGASQDGYRFPLPDNPAFIRAINDFISWYNTEYHQNVNPVDRISSLNQVVIPASPGQAVRKAVHFIEQVVHNAFVPLTELPVTYQYIKPNALYPGDYNPLPKKQNIKDENGYMLLPTDPAFDIAPMAKVMDANPSSPAVLFTDFTLDGTSKNIYFYMVKEMNNQMRMGESSPVLGPVKLVNTNAPEAPAIRNVMPVPGGPDIVPAIKFEINPYPENQFIRKITIYRATTLLDAQSIRTMERIGEIDLEEAGMLGSEVWKFYDDLSTLEEIPYGDSLFYRITVSRKVEYHEENTGIITEYAPSQPSKIAATLIVDTSVPESPVPGYSADDSFILEEELHNVVLFWTKTTYKGKYHVYKMNEHGNWIRIKEIMSNEDEILLPLSETDLETDTLALTDENGNNLYHHFKVLVENNSGVASTREHILTIGREDNEIMPPPRNQIRSVEDLIQFGNIISNSTDGGVGETWYLMNDIDLSDVTKLSLGSPVEFQGTFEGNHHTLRNFTARDSSVFSSLGLNGTIRNLYVTNATITTALNTANLSIMCIFVKGLIENCYVQGSITAGADSSASGKGGMASMNLANGKILNCFVNVALKGKHRMGGLTGNNNGIVENCYSTGSLNCTDVLNAGVVAQQGNTGMIKNCVNIMPVIVGKSPSAYLGTCRVYNYTTGRAQNNYSLDTTTINGSIVKGGTLTNYNGQDTADAQLQTETFWKSIGYNFESIWKMSSPTGKFKGYPILVGMEDL